MFCGPRGVGKTTCARILAKTINCDNKSENLEACNECESCTSFNQSHSFNIHELDAASHNSVDDIRSLIEQVRIAPQVGNYSIYIIDEVHMLSVAAFNAFLKTLEEPPSYAVFILATTSKQKIIPTILSRCQIFDFSRIQVEDIANHLASIAAEQGVEAEPDGLHIIAQKADGSLRDALSIFDQMVSFGGKEITYNDVIENLNILDYDYYFKAINAILERNVSDSLLLFDEVLSNGFDGHNYITGLSEHVRNLLVCKDEATLILLQVGERIKKRYLEQSQACTSKLLLDALTLANKCDIAYNTSINKRLHVELLLMQLCSVEGIVENVTPKVNIAPPADVVSKVDNKVSDKVEEPKPDYDKSTQQTDEEKAVKPVESVATTTVEEINKEEVVEEPVAEVSSEESVDSSPEVEVKTEATEEVEVSPEVKDDSSVTETTQEEVPSVGEMTQEDVSSVADATQEDVPSAVETTQEDVPSVAKATQENVSDIVETTQEDDSSVIETTQEGDLTAKEEAPTKKLETEEDAESVGEKEEYKIQTKSLLDFVSASGETEKKIDEDTTELYGETKVTQELFDEVWVRYADLVKEQGKHSLYSTMTKRKPVLGEDNNITIELDNSVQDAELNEEGAALHEFIRKELDNGAINIIRKVIKVKEDRKPYTSMEKFKRMAEKNPSIEKFRKQLNLDID